MSSPWLSCSSSFSLVSRMLNLKAGYSSSSTISLRISPPLCTAGCSSSIFSLSSNSSGESSSKWWPLMKVMVSMSNVSRLLHYSQGAAVPTLLQHSLKPTFVLIQGFFKRSICQFKLYDLCNYYSSGNVLLNIFLHFMHRNLYCFTILSWGRGLIFLDGNPID